MKASFKTVCEWFDRARANAARAGKTDSAVLWADGLEYLQEQNALLRLALEALEGWFNQPETTEAYDAKMARAMGCAAAIRKHLGQP